MNGRCEEFRALWTEWHEGRLDPETADRCATERARCPSCARYDRQMRELVHALGNLPLPDRPTRLTPRSTRSFASRGRAWATAAAIVVAFGAGILLAPLQTGQHQNMTVVRAEAVQLQPQETKQIQVAVAAPRSMDEVRFTIELPEGIELEGYPGQRVVGWQGRLSQGRNRLTLPVRLTRHADDGELIARIRHEDGGSELRVPLRTTGASSSIRSNGNFS